MTDPIEAVARAHDPVGWAWYDLATAETAETAKTGVLHPHRRWAAGLALLAGFDTGLVRFSVPASATERSLSFDDQHETESARVHPRRSSIGTIHKRRLPKEAPSARLRQRRG